MTPLQKLGTVLLLSIISFVVYAEAPFQVVAPKKARGEIVETAGSFKGSPYIYGGTTSAGFDCSGFVYQVYKQSLGITLPRTVREQYDVREPIEFKKLQPGDLLFFNTTGPISHVGIYESDGKFIHAASEGLKTGIIESSLSEEYWAKAYAGAGRIVSPADSLGLVFSGNLEPIFGIQSLLKGVRGTLGVGYKLLGVEAGFELRPEWDIELKDFRLPLVLVIGIDSHLKVFAGPSLTLGNPNLGGTRPYEASGGLLATIGIEYTPVRFHVSGIDFGLTGDLVYNRYVVANQYGTDSGKDFAAGVSAGLGISVRWGL